MRKRYSLKTHYIPVDGTNKPLVAFEFDAVMFDAEVRAALRFMTFETDSKMNSPIGCVISANTRGTQPKD